MKDKYPLTTTGNWKSQFKPIINIMFWAFTKKQGDSMEMAITGLRTINYEERAKDTDYKKRLNKVMTEKEAVKIFLHDGDSFCMVICCACCRRFNATGVIIMSELPNNIIFKSDESSSLSIVVSFK